MTPLHVGCRNLSREFLLSRQSKLAKILIPESELILICDCTYAYHQKSRNNLFQRKSYSMHKHANLCKPFTVCTTDGFILEMFGPYLGTSNDASIMRDLLTNNKDFLSLLRKGDCFVVDRGFRNVVSLLQEKGFVVRMPSCKKKNQSQLSTEECNSSRLVTKIRWVVEAVHGVLKQKWRFLREEISNQSLVKVKPYFEIASALHNLYGKKILCDVGNEEVVAQKILSGLKRIMSLTRTYKKIP